MCVCMCTVCVLVRLVHNKSSCQGEQAEAPGNGNQRWEEEKQKDRGRNRSCFFSTRGCVALHFIPSVGGSTKRLSYSLGHRLKKNCVLGETTRDEAFDD